MSGLTRILLIVSISAIYGSASGQIIPQKFGQGIQVTGKDSTFHLKFGFRFQNLHVAEWQIDDGTLTDYEGSFLVRRSRLKFDGWAVSPKLKYKFELGLSNRDIGGGSGPEFNKTSNFILDAIVAWNFYQNFVIQFGQTKLPGNRERVVSSGNMQFVDRSRLNSRFNIDRDIGLQLKHHIKMGDFVVKETVAFSQGEGRNVTAGHFGAYDYTFKVEVLPLGEFQSKGDYVGADLKREETPKLALAVAFDLNKNAVRERGQLGDFIQNEEGNYLGKDLHTFFADLMFKYQGFSVMSEYANRKTSDDNPVVMVNDSTEAGTFYTGNAFNIQAGYVCRKNWEVALRYTLVNPDEVVAEDETHYTFGLSKYVVGHKLKVQTDFTYLQKEISDGAFIWRTQVDIHF